MTERRAGHLDLSGLLGAIEDAPPVDAADVVGRFLADHLGAGTVSFLIADFSGNALIRLGHSDAEDATRTQGSETAERLPLADSAYGRVLAAQRVEVVEDGDDAGVLVYAPVTNRGEAIGVLELAFDEHPGAHALADVEQAAHVLAYAVIANRRFTDLYEWGQRSVPLSVAAEIQHRLLPAAYTLEAGQFTLAGWLEPAGDNAGDTFDFSLERETLHMSLTDAMGHDTDAALLATLLVGGLRNARRAGVDLAEQARLACSALKPLSGFVTGQLVRVDLPSGTATIVNAGHEPPRRLRDGRVEVVELLADVPFGADPEHRYRVQELPVEPGDRLLFLTDGMLERNAAAVDIDELILAGADDHPREAVQALMAAVLETSTDDGLRDDATAMCFDWHGGPARERDSHAGANR